MAPMDQFSALKFIFREAFDEKARILLYNNQIFHFKNEDEDFFLSVLNGIDFKANEASSKPVNEFDTNVEDIKKITEEQFIKWKDSKKKDKIARKETGKELWLGKNRETLFNDENM